MSRSTVRARILLLEENQPVGRPLAEWLRLGGYDTDWVGSVREALLLAQSGRWDAIVLNVGVRAMNGVEFYSRLDVRSGRDCLPIIFVTDYSRQGLLRSLGFLPETPRTPGQQDGYAFLRGLEEYLRKAPPLSG